MRGPLAKALAVSKKFAKPRKDSSKAASNATPVCDEPLDIIDDATAKLTLLRHIYIGVDALLRSDDRQHNKAIAFKFLAIRGILTGKAAVFHNGLCFY